MNRYAAIAILVIILWSFTAQAQPERENFGQLLFGGSLGALIGGAGGALGAYGLCRLITDPGPWADLACLAGAMLFGYAPGVPIGATVGVSIAGHSQKIPGNVWTALLGASLGGAIAFFASDWALRSLGETPQAQQIRDTFIPFVFFGVIPLSAGAGAALGYTLTGRLRTE
ncbi:MAG: hypothetical protein NZ930_06955 [Candidatus Bipolaricaulota bacterium]|nr:hypothetical protein [Candidatus Bipolaricaulota bacterium]MDW8030651.1 hypothetical protein [Candidatus Bipolaricaulota bacterium]